MKLDEFDADLFELVTSVVAAGDEIHTLSINRPNWITAIDRTGLWVETVRSKDRDSGPQFVPAWMVAAAWDRLRGDGSLSQDELLNDLNVKRSAFVCALLAQFPDVAVRDTQPIVLELAASSDAYSTHPVTASDREAGRIRIPQATKPIFPDAKQVLGVVLRGQSMQVSWDPRNGPDRSRSGVLSIGRQRLGGLVDVGEVLSVQERGGGRFVLS